MAPVGFRVPFPLTNFVKIAGETLQAIAVNGGGFSVAGFHGKQINGRFSHRSQIIGVAAIYPGDAVIARSIPKGLRGAEKLLQGIQLCPEGGSLLHPIAIGRIEKLPKIKVFTHLPLQGEGGIEINAKGVFGAAGDRVGFLQEGDRPIAVARQKVQHGLGIGLFLIFKIAIAVGFGVGKLGNEGPPPSLVGRFPLGGPRVGSVGRDDRNVGGDRAGVGRSLFG